VCRSHRKASCIRIPFRTIHLFRQICLQEENSDQERFLDKANDEEIKVGLFSLYATPYADGDAPGTIVPATVSDENLYVCKLTPFGTAGPYTINSVTFEIFDPGISTTSRALQFAWRIETPTQSGSWASMPDSTQYNIEQRDLLVSEINQTLQSDETFHIRIKALSVQNSIHVNKISITWNQRYFVNASDFPNSHVTSWTRMSTYPNLESSYSLTNATLGWEDELDVKEQYFVWFKREIDLANTTAEDYVKKPNIGFVSSVGYKTDGVTRVEYFNPDDFAPPEAPEDFTGVDESATGEYTLTWDLADGAEYYEIEEETSSSTSVIWSGPANVSFVKNRKIGEYKYRVRGISLGGAGDWTAQITIAVVQALTPQNLTVPATSTTGTYQVSWDRVEKSTRYELQERTGASGSWITIFSDNELSYTRTDKTTGNYYYKVRAVNNNTGNSDWSNIVEINVI